MSATSFKSGTFKKTNVFDPQKKADFLDTHWVEVDTLIILIRFFQYHSINQLPIDRKKKTHLPPSLN